METTTGRSRIVVWLAAAAVVGVIAAVLPTSPPASLPTPPPAEAPAATATAAGSIAVDAVPVPLNPEDSSVTALGDFHYAGGLWLTSPHTDKLHELSDITIEGTDRIIAVGDAGIVLEIRLVLDDGKRLVGVADARLGPLVGEDGKPLTDPQQADAEGLALLPNGDRLVSFEKSDRIWLYPAAGGPPRTVPSPRTAFPPNLGMEALTANPDVGPDAYAVGGEESGETWTCRLTTSCVQGPTIEKHEDFGLVAMCALSGGRTAYLLRAYDPVRKNRITLEIHHSSKVIASMHLAPPLTVDNFEGLTSVPGADGSTRFYLVSDDNNSTTQRTLLLAFDWRPR